MKKMQYNIIFCYYYFCLITDNRKQKEIKYFKVQHSSNMLIIKSLHYTDKVSSNIFRPFNRYCSDTQLVVPYTFFIPSKCSSGCPNKYHIGHLKIVWAFMIAFQCFGAYIQGFFICSLSAKLQLIFGPTAQNTALYSSYFFFLWLISCQ